jgi:inward rectifier potassium channel
LEAGRGILLREPHFIEVQTMPQAPVETNVQQRFPLIRELGDMQRLAHRQVAGFDLYHHVMAASWLAFFALLAVSYVAFNFAFGLLYLISPGSLANAQPGSIADAFFFSVHAMAAQSYRDIHAATLYGDLLGTAEVMCGLVIIALITSLVFARFSRPKAGIVFSHRAIITTNGDRPALLIRVANQRNNLVIDAEATAMLTHDVQDDTAGFMRRFQDLKFERCRTPFWALTWTLMHPIDRSSPLWGLSHDDLIAQNGEICIAITGIDETLAVPVCGHFSYPAGDILWNHRFADVFSRSKAGRFQIDFGRLNETVTVPE